MEKFDCSNLKCVGFDLDQTLYKETEETHRAYRDELYRLLSEELGIRVEEAEERFVKSYAIIGSGTEAARVLGVKEPEKMSAEVSLRARQDRYLKFDQKLVALIAYLRKRYTLFLITASAEESSRLKLKKLGLDLDHDFTHAFFGDSGYGSKVKGKCFLELIKKTRCQPHEHLYAGDRDTTDIVPAKKAGMKTAIVWTTSRVADLSLPTIYDLGDWV